jgi:ABC-type proline/glycine betaine transport system permease subunit
MLPDLGSGLQRAVSRGVDWAVITFGDMLEGFSAALVAPVLLAEALLVSLPPLVGVAIIAGLAFAARRRVPFMLGMAALALGLALLGLWPQAMQTLALILVAMLIIVLLGLPLGMLAGRSRRVSRIAAAIYDVMQTVPSFVYLIPVAMLLGLGRAPALVATIIYALPPLARLTELGLREVDRGVVEGARTLGLSSLKTLWLVELPLARPAILQGLNQSIMMALAMVVVASMIGAKGLGEVVLLGLQRADAGLGFVGGLGIVLLAILIDRLAQAFCRPPHLLRLIRGEQ